MSNEIAVNYSATGKATVTAKVFQPNGSVRESYTAISLSDSGHNGFYLGDAPLIEIGDIVQILDDGTIIGGGEYGISKFDASSDTVTVGTNEDKSDYTLDSGYDACKTSAQVGSQMTLQDSAITADKIASNAITATKIASNAITDAKIAAAALNGKGDWNTTTPPTVEQIATAIKNSTGWTEGGTFTFAEVVKLLTAWAAGEWTAGLGTSYNVMDAEDSDSAVINVQLNEDEPYKEVTIL